MDYQSELPSSYFTSHTGKEKVALYLAISVCAALMIAKIPLFLGATGQPAAWAAQILATVGSWKTGRRPRFCKPFGARDWAKLQTTLNTLSNLLFYLENDG